MRDEDVPDQREGYMSSKNLTSESEIDLTCSRCRTHQLERLERKGFLQRRIYPLLGYYPWECPLCRETVMLKLRYRHRTRHGRRSRASSQS